MASKALKALNLAREYLGYGFTTLRDLESMDPEIPCRRALSIGVAERQDLLSMRTPVTAASVLLLRAGCSPIVDMHGPADDADLRWTWAIRA